MKSKASASLLELSVMLLVFALAAALCLRAFVWADQRATLDAACDVAALAAQQTAEQLKASHGAQLQNGQWTRQLDESGHPAPDGAYKVTATEKNSDIPGLKRASVSVCDVAGRVLFEIDVAWQEVVGS